MDNVSNDKVSDGVMNDKSARSWAAGCHLASLIMFLGVPFGNLLGPLVVWQMKRKEHPFVDDQGTEAVNFQITMTICWVVLGIGAFFVIAAMPFYLPIEDGTVNFALMPVAFFAVMLLFIGLLFLDVALSIVGAVRANDGIAYRYPLTLRLIK